jgi:hypothetical protein
MIEFDVSWHNFASHNLMSFVSFDVTGSSYMIIEIFYIIVNVWINLDIF